MSPKAHSRPVRWGVWFAWVAATTMAEAIKWFIGEASTEWQTFVIGASVGLAQWLVLRRHIPVARWFVLATAFGLVYGMDLSLFVLGGAANQEPSTVAVGAMTGLVVGIMQVITMRRDASRLSQVLNPAGFGRAIENGQQIVSPLPWILATTAGVAVGLAAPEILPRVHLWLGYSAANTLQSLIDTITMGASVGLAQWLVVRRRIPEARRWWAWATLGGLAVGFYLVERVGIIERSAYVALGAAIGLAQWPVLRRQIPDVRWWPVATALGCAIGCIIRFKLPAWLWDNATVGSAVWDAVVGSLIGFVQWLILRRQVPNAGRWILWSAIGFSVGFTSVYEVGRAVGGNFEGYARGIFGTAASLAVYGMITGLGLVRLCNGRKVLNPSAQNQARDRANRCSKYLDAFDNSPAEQLGPEFLSVYVLQNQCSHYAQKEPRAEQVADKREVVIQERSAEDPGSRPTLFGADAREHKRDHARDDDKA